MKNTHLLSLLDNEDVMGFIMHTLGTFVNEYKMSSLQAIHSVRNVITGIEEVRDKIDRVQDQGQREELVTWYCFYLYLWGIKNETFQVVLGR